MSFAPTRLRKPQKTTPLFSRLSSYDIHRLTWGWFARSSVTIQTTSITFMMLLGNGTFFQGASWCYHSPEVYEGCVINESWESKASVFGRKTNATTIKGNAGSACLKICSHFCSNFVGIDAELYVNMFLGNVWGIIHCIGLCRHLSSDAVRIINQGWWGGLINRCFVILSQTIMHRSTEIHHWKLEGNY